MPTLIVIIAGSNDFKCLYPEFLSGDDVLEEALAFGAGIIVMKNGIFEAAVETFSLTGHSDDLPFGLLQHGSSDGCLPDIFQ